MARVLLVGGNCSAGLAIVQSLGRAGHEVALFGADDDHPAFASRYPRQRGVHPDPMREREAYTQWVIAHHQSEGYEVIIPPTEETLLPLHEERKDIGPALAIPDADSIELAFDKERVLRLSNELGVPNPESVLVEDPNQLHAVPAERWFQDGGAVVVKTTRSKIWEAGAAREFAATGFTSRGPLEEHARALLRHTPLQLQQWVPGVGVGINLIADRGEVRLVMAHRRVHEVPLTGGASSYRESVEPPAQLLEDASRLIRALRWHGVAMVEFRYDATTERRWLMEINGRFWGSLPLATFAGADFPAALVELWVEGAVKPRPKPRTGVFARRFTRELAWLKQSVRSRDDSDPRLLKRPLSEAIVQWARPLWGKETWDGASLRDPLPLLYELRSAWGDEVATVKRKLVRAALLWQWGARSHQNLQRIGSPKHIVVLCYGNICRSPYAERRLKEALAGQPVEISSAGFHQKTQRPTPERIQVLAAAHGVDLGDHRSQATSPEALGTADLVVVMDEKNHLLLEALHAPALKKTVWLGAFDEEGPLEIDDPYDLSPEDAEGVYRRLDAACAGLTAALVGVQSTR
ncbi:MAG: ATP-grasp domain-containing protein [Deltaproteobacteria bacterium]|nr:ATP-grasp domain-containing protein [Deltaproteobacteria bacterium]